MRILMLAQFYPPTVGGEEQHVGTLSAELASRGHHVAVATLADQGSGQCPDSHFTLHASRDAARRGRSPHFELDGRVRVYRIRGTLERATWLFSEAGRRHAPPFPDPELVLGLRRVVAAERPNIVHAHNWLVHSFLPLKTWSGARLVLTLHDYSLVCATKGLVYQGAICSGPGRLKCLACASSHYGPAKGVPTAIANEIMSRLELSAVDAFVAVSRATALGNRLKGVRGPGAPRVRVIPNFLPDGSGSQAGEGGYADLLAQLPGQDFLLFVGDLRLFKGIDVLLRTYAGLSNAPPLVLIGRKCADTPAILPPGVVVLDTWPRGAVMEAWRRSIMGLLPSVGPETFGIVVLEAMDAGRPVVASRIGGLADLVVDGVTGLLVPPGDSEQLRQAIARLLAEPDLREKMGRAAKQRARMYRAAFVVPQIEQVYRELLEGSNR